MAVKFLEPGGDADFAVTATNGFWGAVGNASLATDFVHGSHIKSINHPAGVANRVQTPAGTVADAGGRFSFFIYITAFNASSTLGFAAVRNASNTALWSLAVTSAGVLQLWNKEPQASGSPAQLGSNGPTLATGRWYQISCAWTISTTTVNRFEVFVDGASAISVTNGTLAAISSSHLIVGTFSAASTFSFRSSDYYIDNSTGLAHPGNIWVTAKRPTANGANNQFTTQVGVAGSGYGSGRSPQVNERALSTANGWSISTTTQKTEEYSIEGIAVGDFDLTGATIVDFMGWISAKVDSVSDSPVHHIIVAGAATAKTMTVSAAMYTQIVGSSTYPTGNTDIGMDGQFTTTPHVTTLYECGIIVAFIPFAAVPPPTFQQQVIIT